MPSKGHRWQQEDLNYGEYQMSSRAGHKIFCCSWAYACAYCILELPRRSLANGVMNVPPK